MANKFNISTVHLELLGKIHDCRFTAGIMSFYLKYQLSSIHFYKFDLSVTSNPGGVDVIWLTSISE